MDKDNSGSLSMNEVMEVVQAFNVPVSMNIATEIFNSVDKNKDGEIDLKETNPMRVIYLLLAFSFPILHAEVITTSRVTTNTSNQLTNQSSNVTSDTTSTHDNLSFQFSVWLIVLLSFTSLFAIWFILCGLFRRADAYRMPGMEVPEYGFGGGYGLSFGGGGGGGGLFSGLNYDEDV
ncbi:unnamed protein product [Rodentolepis nana]|uniref:Calmodulin n=1 Tax=Rodentolepis nana TaxID=102285 RepID=A0A0R3TCE9_RODNA|nr:unnamed protein product [Rodentolepis nana]